MYLTEIEEIEREKKKQSSLRKFKVRIDMMILYAMINTMRLNYDYHCDFEATIGDQSGRIDLWFSTD